MEIIIILQFIIPIITVFIGHYVFLRVFITKIEMRISQSEKDIQKIDDSIHSFKDFGDRLIKIETLLSLLLEDKINKKI